MLELFHPDGCAERTLVLGAQPPGLLVSTSPGAATRHDLILIAPGSAEVGAAGWAREAALVAASHLAPDGLVYLLASPRDRLRLRRHLRALGLVEVAVMAHVPDWSINRCLVPLRPSTARYAFSNLLPMRRAKRWLGMFAGGVPRGWAAAARVLPWVGVALQRHGARVPFEWAFRLGGWAAPPGPIIVETSWRGLDGGLGTVLHCFSAAATHPLGIAKLTLGRRLDGAADEASLLAALAPSARQAGARVPSLLAEGKAGGRQVLVQSIISGRTAAWILASQSGELASILERVADWLERWNQATRVASRLDAARLERELLSPARLLSPLLEGGQAYVEWLSDRCDRLVGAPVPLVAIHNDLTMSNVLIDDGQLGIVDWEGAAAAGLPLVDLFFALGDGLLVCGAQSWLTAVRSFATRGGAFKTLAWPLISRQARGLGLDNEIITLCFHACWLQRAAAEYGYAHGTTDPRPFLEVAQWLVAVRPE